MEYWKVPLMVFILTYIVYRARSYQRYFDKWGIPQPEEIPFIGFIGKRAFTGEHMNYLMKKLYNVNKSAKYVGCHVFSAPIIVIRDLELIKTVLIKEFEHFSAHKSFVSEHNDPLFGKNLLFLNGEKWRKLRHILSPSFTSSKMHFMYELISSYAKDFSKNFLDVCENEEAVDMKNAFTKYTNDVIATCAFGIEVDSLKNPKNEFYVHGKSAVLDKVTVIMKLFFIRLFPNLAEKSGLRIISKYDTDFFVSVIKSTLKIRREKKITRPDMLQLMIDAKDKNEELGLELIDMTAQAFVFFLAGFETTSSMLSMISYELAMNLSVQKKLQDEIDDMMRQCNNKPTYESISSLPYLDAVLTETLRLHSIPFLNRICTKEFELPPALSGSKPYLIKSGMEIMIPVVGIHYDPSYYENPEVFDPERHSDRKAATSDVTSLGFGLGPRMCIGNRFAILETKVLLVHLLAQSSFLPCRKTFAPLKYESKNIFPLVKGGCWLKVKKRAS